MFKRVQADLLQALIMLVVIPSMTAIAETKQFRVIPGPVKVVFMGRLQIDAVTAARSFAFPPGALFHSAMFATPARTLFACAGQFWPVWRVQVLISHAGGPAFWPGA
jgi:hypothetical protein